MKRLNKIALTVMVVVAVGIGFSGCDIADESKAPLIEIGYSDFFGLVIGNLYSQDDETIIKDMTISGRNGKCNIKDLGAGGKSKVLFEEISQLKYGEKIPYNKRRLVTFESKNCPTKNGKYEIELKTNFGTYRYEVAVTEI